MNDGDREQLRNVLVGYFGDRSTEDGVREMLGVTRANEEYHRRYRGALAAGLDAARGGDEDAYRAARQLSPLLPDVAAAERMLAEILEEYDRQYGAP